MGAYRGSALRYQLRHPIEIMKMTLAMIVLFCLLAGIASAQWAGWPMQDNPNYTFYGINSDYDPVSQLWYAVSERWIATDVNAEGPIWTWQAPTGTNSVIVTNDGRVFTNLTLTYTTLTYQVDAVNLTNRDIMHQEVYVYTDDSGTHTATSSLPYLGDWQFLSDSILGGVDQIVFNVEDDPGDKSFLSDWVVTNYATSATFNTYFELENGATGRPIALPTYTYASLQFYEGYGFGTNYTTDSWGFIAGSTVTNSVRSSDVTNMAWMTSFPTNAVSWPLSEGVYTGTAWQTHYIDTLGTNSYGGSGFAALQTHGSYLMDPSIKPVLLYQHGTNDIAARDVTISGLVYQAEITTAFRYVDAVSETISATGTNDCTLQWFRVDSITVDGAGNQHDSYSVIYTNTLAMYSEPGYGSRLYALSLDERYKAMRSLVWTSATGDNGDDWRSMADDNFYLYTGTGATISAAIADASNNIPFHSLAQGAPYRYSQISDNGPSIPETRYVATSGAGQAWPIISQATGVRTNFARRAEFYVMFNSNGVWNTQGADIRESVFSNVVDSTINIFHPMTSSVPIGTTNMAPNWPAAAGKQGWKVVSNHLAVIRWDVQSAEHLEFRYQ